MAVSHPPNSVFQYNEQFDVTEEVKKAFDINGYILLKGLLNTDEITLLKTVLEKDQGLLDNAYGRQDGGGRKTKTVLWNQLGDDVTGIIARSEKMAGTFGKLLEGEVYHYHSKVIMKEPHTGGAHIWHQDYGYWYENGCIFPHMGTAWIAVDKADRGNGCLKILQGSQRVGRVTHTKVGDQAEADTERVAHVEKFCPLLHVEVDPGDCLFFHCNILHRSDQNSSERRRWAFLVSYNRRDNDPVYKHHHPQYTPLQKVPNSAILECSPIASNVGKDFFEGPKTDFSLHKIEKMNK